MPRSAQTHTQAEINPYPDQRRDRQPKPTSSKPKLFLSFLLWRTEGEHSNEKEKKWKREKKIGQNERERERKKKKRLVKNNKITG